MPVLNNLTSETRHWTVSSDAIVLIAYVLIHGATAKKIQQGTLAALRTFFGRMGIYKQVFHRPSAPSCCTSYFKLCFPQLKRSRLLLLLERGSRKAGGPGSVRAFKSGCTLSFSFFLSANPEFIEFSQNSLAAERKGRTPE